MAKQGAKKKKAAAAAEEQPAEQFVRIPVALIDAAHDAKAVLDQKQTAFLEAAEARRQAKEALEAAQEVYNEASERVLTYRKKDGFPADSPLAKTAKAAPDAWRGVKLVKLGLKPRTLKAFAAHTPPLTTLGQLTDHQEKAGDFWAKDIKGVGPKVQDEIADATERFWKDHPEYCQDKSHGKKND